MASLVWLLSLLAILLTTVTAENATIFNMTHVPGWQRPSVMKLAITAPDADVAPITYEVYPLTASLGLNGTDTARMAVMIRGLLVSADMESNYVSDMDENSVVYLNCDQANSTDVINAIMTNETVPTAILLYSEAGDCCGIRGNDLAYQTIFTMGNVAEAKDALNFTNTGTIATITGTLNNTAPDSRNGQGGSNSAVAMSILYSITGLITLLFLIIIATGAFRAHRYPERYGPRSGHGGRPRQSRAKGLARAVLETIPIVKFGESNQAKPDPALELEHQPSRSSHDPATGTRLSAIPEEPRSARIRPSEAIPPTIEESPSQVASTTDVINNDGTATTNVNAVVHGANDEHLGCSICTEDFTVGEDVRVLPCDHKFHPPCIDPWLINISGTCPLCRLDLRPQDSVKEGSPPSSGSSEQSLPPPLAGDWHQEGNPPTTTTTQRRRSSRLLDLHRLRHASVEERIEILRLHRSQSQQQQQSRQQHDQAQTPASSGGDAAEREEGHRAARLTNRLRDKFRIRTTRRGESPGRQGGAGQEGGAATATTTTTAATPTMTAGSGAGAASS